MNDPENPPDYLEIRDGEFLEWYSDCEADYNKVSKEEFIETLKMFIEKYQAMMESLCPSQSTSKAKGNL